MGLAWSGLAVKLSRGFRRSRYRLAALLVPFLIPLSGYVHANIFMGDRASTPAADSAADLPAGSASSALSERASVHGDADQFLRRGLRDDVDVGYPLARKGGFALRYYWVALERRFAGERANTPLYTRRGGLLGRFPRRFYRSLVLEGSGILNDGRVLNYAGRCKYGRGVCFEVLDPERYPVGRGAGRRPLIPFKSVAVDPRLVSIGEPLFVPELAGLVLPDGTVHDGCVRADDTGGNIKRRKMDFFVVERENFHNFRAQLAGNTRITPHIAAPQCAYLRDS
jgi:hypothetical protein